MEEGLAAIVQYLHVLLVNYGSKHLQYLSHDQPKLEQNH